MWSRVRILALPLAAGLLMAACVSAPPAPRGPPRDAVTAAAIERVLAGDQRAAESRARDVACHPEETLLFFGIKPAMTMVEVWPGPAGWYTEILAPLLAEQGKLYVAEPPPAPGNVFVTDNLKAFADKLAARPDVYGKVERTTLGADAAAIAPPGSADLAVSFLNLHGWMNLGMAPAALTAISQALKPGGTFGIVDNRGNAAKPQDPHATNGYVNEDYAIRLIEAAGFVLLEKSEINANARDTKDYEQGVWALPPNYRLGNRDRAKYQAIGEADRFTLKFRKK